MRREAFTLLHKAEHSWWYRGRARIISKVLGKHIFEGNGSILDFGSGFGGMAPLLSRFGEAYAFEPDVEARSFSEKHEYKKVYATSDEALGVNKYSLIALFDVIEHIEDDAIFLSRLRDNLEDGGGVIVTVPAYQWLWSAHDIAHHHFRRYSKKQINVLIEKNGFNVTYINYWNMFLSFPASIVRLLGFSGEGSLNMNPFLDRLFYFLIFLESLSIPMLSLPFGTGIVIFAEKK